MPLFFLLSGFSLALSYGKKTYAGYSTCCCGPFQCMDPINCRGCRKAQNGQEIFDSAKYYFNRVTRILPGYWLTLILAIPLIPLGHADAKPNSTNSVVGTVLSFFGLQTWVLHFGFGPNGPSWTISTLVMFYFMFPCLIVLATKQTNLRLYQLISICFWAQLIIGYGFLTGLGGNEGAYWVATAWPGSRWPVFFMGVFAGVLCTRIQKGDRDAYARKYFVLLRPFWAL